MLTTRADAFSGVEFLSLLLVATAGLTLAVAVAGVPVRELVPAFVDELAAPTVRVEQAVVITATASVLSRRVVRIL
jgi:hypothetical protein